MEEVASATRVAHRVSLSDDEDIAGDDNLGMKFGKSPARPGLTDDANVADTDSNERQAIASHSESAATLEEEAPTPTPVEDPSSAGAGSGSGAGCGLPREEDEEERGPGARSWSANVEAEGKEKQRAEEQLQFSSRNDKRGWRQAVLRLTHRDLSSFNACRNALARMVPGRGCHEIDLSHCGITSEGLPCVVELCKRAPELRTLKLHHNCIRSGMAGTIQNIFDCCQNLRELHLSHNVMPFCELVSIPPTIADRYRQTDSASPPFWLRVEHNPGSDSDGPEMVRHWQREGHSVCAAEYQSRDHTREYCAHGCRVHVLVAHGKLRRPKSKWAESQSYENYAPHSHRHSQSQSQSQSNGREHHWSNHNSNSASNSNSTSFDRYEYDYEYEGQGSAAASRPSYDEPAHEYAQAQARAQAPLGAGCRAVYSSSTGQSNSNVDASGRLTAQAGFWNQDVPRCLRTPELGESEGKLVYSSKDFGQGTSHWEVAPRVVDAGSDGGYRHSDRGSDLYSGSVQRRVEGYHRDPRDRDRERDWQQLPLSGAQDRSHGTSNSSLREERSSDHQVAGGGQSSLRLKSRARAPREEPRRRKGRGTFQEVIEVVPKKSTKAAKAERKESKRKEDSKKAKSKHRSVRKHRGAEVGSGHKHLVKQSSKLKQGEKRSKAQASQERVVTYAFQPEGSDAPKFFHVEDKDGSLTSQLASQAKTKKKQPSTKKLVSDRIAKSSIDLLVISDGEDEKDEASSAEKEKAKAKEKEKEKGKEEGKRSARVSSEAEVQTELGSDSDPDSSPASEAEGEKEKEKEKEEPRKKSCQSKEKKAVSKVARKRRKMTTSTEADEENTDFAEKSAAKKHVDAGICEISDSD